MVILKTFEKKDIPELLDWMKDSDAEFLIQFGIKQGDGSLFENTPSAL